MFTAPERERELRTLLHRDRQTERDRETNRETERDRERKLELENFNTQRSSVWSIWT